MIREIVKDEAFLAQKSDPATEEDLPAARDLLDTLAANRERCVGMAANMIGVRKRIIVFEQEGNFQLLFNPEIVKKSGPYPAQEACLSLAGVRAARRYRSIKVRYQNERFRLRFKTFTGFVAQIIQHEIDHCEGILI
ncbi:MAG: peptide deformylase [Provencibacterium sp.]|jgi:peptide deformylase|nr:peptide deformylase [Provencibacterium sp.]